MKKGLLLLFSLSLLLLSGCRAHYPVAQQSGKEDAAYLLFIGQSVYGEKNNKTVTVTIDNEAPFTANVVKQKEALRRGTQYRVNTGARQLTVSSEGKILYQKQVFLSPQEVKQIILP